MSRWGTRVPVIGPQAIYLTLPPRFSKRKENKKQKLIHCLLAGEAGEVQKRLHTLHTALPPFTQEMDTKSWTQIIDQSKQLCFMHFIIYVFWLFISFECGWLCTKGFFFPSDLLIVKLSLPRDCGSPGHTCSHRPPSSLHPLHKVGRHLSMLVRKCSSRWPWAQWGTEARNNLKLPAQGQSHPYLYVSFPSQVRITFWKMVFGIDVNWWEVE